MDSQRCFLVAPLLLAWCSSPGSDHVPAPDLGNPAASRESEATSSTGGPREAGAALPALAPLAHPTTAIDHGRIEQDIRFIAKPRSPGSPHANAVRDRCANVLAEAGFEVERHAFSVVLGDDRGARAGQRIEGVNVVGRRAGSDPAGKWIGVGAHFDHIADCAGADDNASGTAAALELARVLGPKTHRNGLLVACWDREEDGLVGSGAWVDQNDLSEFGAYFNFDAIGIRRTEENSQTIPDGFELVFPAEVERWRAGGERGDFVAVFSDADSKPLADALARHADAIKLPYFRGELPRSVLMSPPARDLRRSDHANFWRVGVPALLLSDTAPFRTNTYHCEGAPDVADNIDIQFVAAITRVTLGAVEEALATKL